MKKSGLSKIPSASSLVRARKGTSSLEVTGTPPPLKDIPSMELKNLFWSAGLIDAINDEAPTGEQCQELFTGSADGSSSGFLGCYSAQQIGYAFQSIMEGGASTCYMKNAPTTGALTLVDGSYPNGKVTDLFTTPSGSQDRLIKLQIAGFGDGGGQTGFIKLDSESKLASNGLQYAYTVWFCQDGEAQASNYERSTVSLSGEFKYEGVNLTEGSEFKNEVVAQLVKSGSGIEFDPAQNRTAKTSHESAGSKFKSIISILPSNIISTKVKEVFNGASRESYSLASFSGSGLSSFRVRSSALKEVFTATDGPSMSNTAGVEFRDPRYVSAPTASLVDGLDDVSLDTDSFFDQDASVTPELGDKSCDASADIVVSMNFSNPKLMELAAKCEAEKLDNMDFCRGSAELTAALGACSGG
jgi:hypothetical protein